MAFLFKPLSFSDTGNWTLPYPIYDIAPANFLEHQCQILSLVKHACPIKTLSIDKYFLYTIDKVYNGNTLIFIPDSK